MAFGYTIIILIIGKINSKIYSLVSILTTIIGIALFWIFK